jgi:hypothetical protein
MDGMEIGCDVVGGGGGETGSKSRQKVGFGESGVET